MLEASAPDSSVQCKLSIRSRFLLIGEFLKWDLRELYERLELASRARAEIIEIIVRTSEIEDDTSQLDGLVRRAGDFGLCVLIKFVVNSNRLKEVYLINEPARDDFTIPDYVNRTQLEYGKSLLKRIIRHYDSFPNVAGYQVDWGFWGESWIPWPLWTSASSNASFISFLHRLSEQFRGFNVKNYAWWPLAGAYHGSMMFHSEIFNESDPRHNPLNVAVFYWYQYWRHSMQVNITRELRSAAKSVTSKPVLGFSYTHTSMNVMAYSYTADEELYGCYCDSNPALDKSGNPASPNDFTIRDANYEGLHVIDLDFDTPYFRYEDAETVIAGLYARGILPKVFWPQWSKALHFERVRALLEVIDKYRDYATQGIRGEVLLVTGNIDVGVIGYKNPLSPAHISSLMSRSPPGIIRTLETNGAQFDIVDAGAYKPELGSKYKAVIVHAPRDTLDGILYGKLRVTPRPVVIMHSSFMFSSPNREQPTKTTSAYFENSNPIGLGNDRVYVEIWGYPPSVNVIFKGFLSDLPPLRGYKPNWLSSTYRGIFDEVLATAEVEAGTVIAREGNIYFFGLDMSTQDTEHNEVLQNALLRILSRAGVKSEPGLSQIISENIIVAKVHDEKPNYLPTGGKVPIDYPFFNGSHIITASAVTTRLSYEPQPYLLAFPQDAIKQPAYKTYNGTHYIINFVTKGGRFLMYTPTIPEQLTINGFDISWRWANFSVIEFLIPLSTKPTEQRVVVKPYAPPTTNKTMTLTVAKTITHHGTVTAYATRTVTEKAFTIIETITFHETVTAIATTTITSKETFNILPEVGIPIYLLLVTITAATSFTVFILLRKTRRTGRR